MPARTPTPCRKRGCRALVSDRSGYCEAHQGESWARQRAKPGRKIYGTEWRKLRAVALRRDRGLCVLCLADGRVVPATEVDHIVAVEHGGTDALSNLQSICTPHHRSKTARERLRRKTG